MSEVPLYPHCRNAAGVPRSQETIPSYWQARAKQHASTDPRLAIKTEFPLYHERA